MNCAHSISYILHFVNQFIFPIGVLILKTKNNPNIRVIFKCSQMGCLSGIEPEITGPQPAVLPLHHRHH